MSVDAAFVAFGVTKPAFQIEIILRQSSDIATGKETRFKTQQDFRHLLSHEISAGLTGAMQFAEANAAGLTVALCRIERRGNATHDFHMPANHRQFVSHTVETAIDAARQTLQCLFCGAPFLSQISCKNFCVTSPTIPEQSGFGIIREKGSGGRCSFV